MKLKSKVLISILGIFLWIAAAGSAMANNFDVTYTITSVSGGYDLTFSITNNMDTYYNKGVRNFFVSAGESGSNPYNWLVTYGPYNFSNIGAADIDYLIRFQDDYPLELQSGVTMDGFSVFVRELPQIINYVIQANGSDILYEESDAFLTGKAPAFEGVASHVTEPVTLLLLGFGLVGIGGIRRKFNK